MNIIVIQKMFHDLFCYNLISLLIVWTIGQLVLNLTTPGLLYCTILRWILRYADRRVARKFKRGVIQN